MPIDLDFTIESIADTALIIRPIHISAAQTITIGSVFVCDASGGAFTLTLPAASAEKRILVIIKSDSSVNAVTISRDGSDTIEGSTTLSLASQYDYAILVNDEDNGNIWYNISK